MTIGAGSNGPASFFFPEKRHFYRTFASGRSFANTAIPSKLEGSMKKLGFLIFVAALVLGLVAATMSSFGKVGGKFFNFSFNVGSVKGSGQTGTDIRQVSNFKGVDVSGVFEVEVTAQKEYSVEVEADDNLLPLITTKVRNGVLHIETERRISTDNPLRIRISAPDIENIDSSGAASVSVVNLKNENISVDSSGASKVKLGGETAKLTLDISGATKVDAEGLTAVSGDIEASGASSALVNVTGKLWTDASGASKIVYVGSPTDVVKKTSRASSVVQK